MIEIGIGVPDQIIDNYQPVVLFLNDDAQKALETYAGRSLKTRNDIRDAVSEWVEDALFEIISVFIEVNRTVVDTEVFHVDFIEESDCMSGKLFDFYKQQEETGEIHKDFWGNEIKRMLESYDEQYKPHAYTERVRKILNEIKELSPEEKNALILAGKTNVFADIYADASFGHRLSIVLTQHGKE